MLPCALSSVTGYLPAIPPFTLPIEAVPYKVVATWEEYVRGTNQTTTITRQVAMRMRRQLDYYEVWFTTQAPFIAKKGNLEPLEEVALQLAGLYEQVVIKCSLTGRMQELLNHDALLARWQVIRQHLYRVNPSPDPVMTYLIGFCEQQLQNPADVLNSLRFDYVYQTLLDSWTTAAGNGRWVAPPEREFPQFFPTAGLQFNEQTSWEPAPTYGSLVRAIRGALDAQQTDMVAVREYLEASLAKGSVSVSKGSAQGMPHIDYQATHLVDQASGLPVHIDLSVFARLTEIYKKQYSLQLTRL